MERIFIDLEDNSYTIDIEDGLIYKLKETMKGTQQWLIITDDHVDKYYAVAVQEGLKDNHQILKYVIPPGEMSKNIDTVTSILNYMLDNNFSRNGKIIALGGGVVGDIAGFCASIYMRGIDFLQVPTSLLAQVDSSVGGKTGINMPQGKNLVGTFYQPKKVLIDTAVLKTLPRKEFISGIGEVIKYALICDYGFFIYLRKHLHQILQLDKEILKYTIKKCCTIKANIVSQDEKEKGLRKILNFGHTIGHGLETITEFKQYTHGEAVIIGMYQEAKIALKLSLIDEGYFKEIESLLSNFDINFNCEIDQLLKAMKRDKKNQKDRISFILPNGLGSVKEVLLTLQETKQLISL